MPGAAVVVGYLLLAVLIDARAKPAGMLRERGAFGWAVSVAALSLLFGAWFALSWRPAFAGIAALITLAIVIAISNLKFKDIREPLNVLDFALAWQAWRHPRLYRAEFLHRWPFRILAAATCAVALSWWALVEPSVAPAGYRLAAIAGGLLLIAGALGWLIAGPLPEVLLTATHRHVLPVDCARHVSDFGLAGSLLAGLIAWRKPVSSVRAWPRSEPCVAEPAPVVLAVQCESFVDLARSGVRDVDLPGLRAARERSIAHGRALVPVEGAWTLRCEFSFLAGLPLSAFGVDALHPYLRLDRVPRTLAHHLRDGGFHTVFVHPFDSGFFNRNAAMPALGFDRTIGEDAFDAAAIDGFYVSDLAVAELVLDLARRDARPLLCFAATMENHNPWSAQRLPGLQTAVDKYVYHLRNSDRMIARLFEGLERLGRPVVFAFYGDHVPTLPTLADPFPDTSTDYFVAALQNGRWLAGAPHDRPLHALADVVLDALAKVMDRRSCN